ncbi:sigma 54-interacting transcriptional regulator [Sorangium sp. So ce281]|uniref:sigma 54-interacting transcriptional regulator n=1 Tax=unclassified Sorangium TaxID=2621164 RepID=UPI003F5FA9F7
MDDQRHDDGRNDTSTEKLPGGGDGPPARPRPRGVSVLFFHRGGVEAMRLDPGQPGMVVGRRAPADLCIPDKRISHLHAGFTLVGGHVLVEDLGSTNGTWVNGERITTPTMLAPGADAILGDVSAHVVAIGPIATPVVLDEATFHRELDEERTRAQCLRRSFSVLAVHPGESEAAHAKAGEWAMQLPANLRPVDRVSMWRDTALILIPDADALDAVKIAHAVASGGGNQSGVRRVGVAVYRENGSSPQKLIDEACNAADLATPERPVIAASSTCSAARDDRPIFGLAQQRVVSEAKKVASTNLSVLLLGESGTGKEVLARFIHDHSKRRDKPFIPVNCGAVPGNLIESTFFGHEKGAFTGAIEHKKGYFQAAHEGTLFLDEIGELEPEAQKRLLRALEARTVSPVGSTKEIPIDVRIIAATNRNIDAMLKDGGFREDLYYRLDISLRIPPLRERLDEIERLVHRFIHEERTSVRDIAPQAMSLLRAYRWPGNVRELRREIRRAVAMAEGDLIQSEDLSSHLHLAELPAAAAEDTTAAPSRPGAAEPPTDLDLRSQLAQIQRQKIEAALREEKTMPKAAKRLGFSLRTLSRRIKELGIRHPER